MKFDHMGGRNYISIEMWCLLITCKQVLIILKENPHSFKLNRKEQIVVLQKLRWASIREYCGITKSFRKYFLIYVEQIIWSGCSKMTLLVKPRSCWSGMVFQKLLRTDEEIMVFLWCSSSATGIQRILAFNHRGPWPSCKSQLINWIVDFPACSSYLWWKMGIESEDTENCIDYLANIIIFGRQNIYPVIVF